MNATYVVAFIALNLVTSNFLITLLPKNVIQFAVGMWSPALFSVVFCLLQGLPIKTTLGLQSGRWLPYLVAFIYPILVGIGTVVLGVSFSLLIETNNFPINSLSVAINLLIWILAALGEELGWRGYLHKSLDNRNYSPVLTGIVWSAWHFNQLITQQGLLYSLLIFTPLLVLLSYVLFFLHRFVQYCQYGRLVWTHGIAFTYCTVIFLLQKEKYFLEYVATIR